MSKVLFVFLLFFYLFLSITTPSLALATPSNFFDIGPILIRVPQNNFKESYRTNFQTLQGHIKYTVFTLGSNDQTRETRFVMDKFEVNHTYPSGSRYPTGVNGQIIGISRFVDSSDFEYLPLDLLQNQKVRIDEVYIDPYPGAIENNFGTYKFISGSGIGKVNEGGNSTGSIVYEVVPSLDQPNLSIEPEILAKKNGKQDIKIKVVLGNNIASNYQLLIGSDVNIGFSCDPFLPSPSSFCKFTNNGSLLNQSKLGSKITSSSVKESNGVSVIFTIDNAQELNNGNYTTSLTSQDNRIQAAKKSFVVQDEDSLLTEQVEINPAKVTQAQTKVSNAKVVLTYKNASNKIYKIFLPGEFRTSQASGNVIDMDCTKISSPICSVDIKFPSGGLPAGAYIFNLREVDVTKNINTALGSAKLEVSSSTQQEVNLSISQCQSDSNCAQSAGIPCNPISGEKMDASSLPGKGDQAANVGGVYTAIGCLPTDPNKLIEKVVGFSAAVGGGIALLLMIFAAFQMITSAGNPDTLKKGQEQFSSAIIGLLFILFSTLLLQIIGVDILNIPGFTKK